MDGDDGEHDEGEGRRYGECDGEHSSHHENIDDEGDAQVGKEIPHLLRVVFRARHQFADGMRVEVGHRQREKMGEQVFLDARDDGES